MQKKTNTVVFIWLAAITISLITFIIIVVKRNEADKAKVVTVYKGFSPTDITLNGIIGNDALKMVSDFTDDNTTLDNTTAVWLSKKWVDEITVQLTKEQNDRTIDADGIRIYFAKKSDKHNTIIIVSTRAGHNDYFQHASTFLDGLRTKPDDIATHIVDNYNGMDAAAGGDPGATLYNDKLDCTKYENCILTAGNNISCEDARNAISNFRTSSHPYQGINTDSEWFSIGFLQAMDAELNNAPADVMADGIRVYFAKNKVNKNRHHFILVTTKKSKTDAGHIDNYQCYDKAQSIIDRSREVAITVNYAPIIAME